jgi:hypothetical protein
VALEVSATGQKQSFTHVHFNQLPYSLTHLIITEHTGE